MPWDTIIPAVIIVMSNVAGGDHNAKSYEFVTACFGWTLLFSFVIAVITHSEVAQAVAMFCMIAVLSRDYEKIFKRILGR